MMFKGTHVIGTRDYDKDVKLIEQQEQLQEQMRAEMSKLRLAQRRGEIDDATKPENKTARYKELDAQFDELVKEQRANMVKNEFNSVLQNNGATFINAFTNNDQTFYFETVPANKLELWFWLESDRLKNRVFREFYSERDVVYEERRLRTESTPTGKFEESFDAVFWDASPYSWPVVGWPTDVANITKAQADEYYSLYYAPQNLTAILVGDFDPKETLAMAEKYLGSIPRGARPAPEMITAETQQLAEKRFYGEAETNPAVDVRWHTPAFQNKDVPALEVLSEALDGPTGRLKRNIVLGSGVATSASSQHDPRKYEGLFEIHGEAKEGHTPEEVEAAIENEVEKLKKDPLTADELQSVKNRYLADSYRQLSNNFQIMLFYGVADGRGNWRDFERHSQEVLKITPDDVKRVANQYFTKENRAVAIWTRKAGSTPDDPALSALPDQAKAMVKATVAKIEGMTDPAQVQQILTRMDQNAGQMPPEMKPAFDYIRAKAQARLTELGNAADAKKD
jgi:predicted Zn-dependent peptidase